MVQLGNPLLDLLNEAEPLLAFALDLAFFPRLQES